MNWFWHALWIAFVVIPLALLWGYCLVDIFVRRDLSGWARLGWLIGVLVLPLLGALTYLAVRPTPVDVVDLRTIDVSEGSVSDEITKLANLRSTGAITEQEFADLKARLLDVPMQRESDRGAARPGSRV
ncbi:MAG TPA: PLDc N-terminal domain-containing protein [Frankiaceae bacterium]|nr:PLDc N-terminal domain-containing protein [Frankiaceae bacterium]